MLCEKCHERKATVFTTQIVDGVSNTSQLCEECALATGILPWDAETAAAAKNASCTYCGGTPCVPCRNGLFKVLGIESENFACMNCHQEIVQFAFRQLKIKPGPAGDLPPDEQQRLLDEVTARMSLPPGELAANPALQDALDAHMRQWLEGIRTASCRYCGGSPCIPSRNWLSLLFIDGPLPDGICNSCHTEFNRFVHGRLRNLLKAGEVPDPSSGLEHLRELLRPVRDEAEKHMQAWVRDRDNPRDTN